MKPQSPFSVKLLLVSLLCLGAGTCYVSGMEAAKFGSRFRAARGGGDDLPPIAAVKLQGLNAVPKCHADADVARALALVKTAAANTKAAATSGVQALTQAGMNDFMFLVRKKVLGQNPTPIHKMFQFCPTLTDINNWRPNHLPQCHDPQFPYEANLAAVTVNSLEFRAGCTAIRTRAQEMQAFITCLAPFYATVTHDLQQLGINDPFAFYSNSESLLSQLAFYAVAKTDNEFHAKVVKEMAHAVGAQAATAHCFANLPQLRETLACYSTFHTSAGVRGHGILADTYDQVVTDVTNGKTAAQYRCHVHPNCARLAAEYLVNFSAKAYDTFSYLETADPSWAKCRTEGGTANCRLYPRCMQLALRRVCGNHEECCVDNAMHVACQNKPDSAACSRICVQV